MTKMAATPNHIWPKTLKIFLFGTQSTIILKFGMNIAAPSMTKLYKR